MFRLKHFHDARKIADRIPDNCDAGEPENSADRTAPRHATIVLNTPAQTQTHRESGREQELRHDRVCIAAVVVSVPQNARADGVIAEEIDQQHAQHCIATKLVERPESGRRGGLRGWHDDVWCRARNLET